MTARTNRSAKHGSHQLEKDDSIGLRRLSFELLDMGRPISAPTRMQKLDGDTRQFVTDGCPDIRVHARLHLVSAHDENAEALSVGRPNVYSRVVDVALIISTECPSRTFTGL